MPPDDLTDLEHLWDDGPLAGPQRGSPMPAALQRRYGGPLNVPIHADRPTVLVNFVSSLDGIVALGPDEERGGGVISGFSEPDRFVMGLLRAAADVLLMGAGTIRGSSSVDWTADHLVPGSAAAFGEWRRSLGLAPQPTTVIVTGSGDVRLGRRGVEDPTVPVVFATTRRGAERLAGLAGVEDRPHVRVEIASDGDTLSPDDLRRFLDQLRGQVVLTEGGPHLLGGLLAGHVVDELFLTLAPQILGRGERGRLGLVEGVDLPTGEAAWQELVSVKRAEHHLFLRFRSRVTPGPAVDS